MKYETKAVGLMALGFGLVGLDRFLITTMFPIIAKDLNLGYSDIGIITGALALAWGASALVMGNLSDRIGRRRVLVGALIVFSLLIGSSGLATSLAGLVFVRVIMGFADGAFTPPSIAATIEASALHRRGRNIGIQQMMLTLFGLGLAPLLVAFLLDFIDWRWIFALVMPPGLILAFAVSKTMQDNLSKSANQHSRTGLLADLQVAMTVRNIRLLAALMLCWLTCLIVTSALMPSWLIDYHHMNTGQMAMIMSAIGFGATAGTLLLPWASDHLGRRPVIVGSALGTLLSLVVLSQIGDQPALLFTALFCIHFFNNAAITLTVGPICAESVAPGLMATASGAVIAVGEIFGGGIAPIAAGYFAEFFGIGHVLLIPTIVIALSIPLALMLSETLPNIQADKGSFA